MPENKNQQSEEKLISVEHTTSRDHGQPEEKVEVVKKAEPLVFDKHREIREGVAGKLAFRLVYLFAGALAVHYAVFLILELNGKTQALDILSDSLNVWLPAMTGLVGAATAYYFSKEL